MCVNEMLGFHFASISLRTKCAPGGISRNGCATFLCEMAGRPFREKIVCDIITRNFAHSNRGNSFQAPTIGVPHTSYEVTRRAPTPHSEKSRFSVSSVDEQSGRGESCAASCAPAMVTLQRRSRVVAPSTHINMQSGHTEQGLLHSACMLIGFSGIYRVS